MTKNETEKSRLQCEVDSLKKEIAAVETRAQTAKKDRDTNNKQAQVRSDRPYRRLCYGKQHSFVNKSDVFVKERYTIESG